MNPLAFRWDGNAMQVLSHHAKQADKIFVIGQVYQMEEVHERSAKSHAAYFATLREGWLSLPDHLAQQFPTPESLRKHALIRTGFFDKRSILAASKTEALRLAAFIRPMDGHAIVTVSNSLVEVFTAKSQSYRAMPKGEFQASKTAVLDWIASLIGTDQRDLERAGREA